MASPTGALIARTSTVGRGLTFGPDAALEHRIA